jgi:hypothetical protein
VALMARITIAGFVSALKPEHLPPPTGPILRFDSFTPPFSDADLTAMERAGLVVVDWRRAEFCITNLGAYHARKKA